MRMYVIVISATLILPLVCSGQGNGPWNSPLQMAWSTDGRQFQVPSAFQDSAGVPSVIRWRGDTLICAFQWFREPRTAPSWDRVAVKFSYDKGATWTQPTPVEVNGLPENYQRPFDPTLAVVDGRIRMYFSSSNGMSVGGLTEIVDTYSAIGDDGIHFDFEPEARYNIVDRPVIDPAVVLFRSQWHYSAPRGAPQEGAHHAVSKDGLSFEPQPPYPSDAQHNWTGNYTVVGDTVLRFYGSGPQLWYSESNDASSWSPYIHTNLRGGDPSVVRIAPDRWLCVYVGPRYVTSVDDQEAPSIIVAPNPTTSAIGIKGLLVTDSVRVVDIRGLQVSSDLRDAPSGVYVLHVERGGVTRCVLVCKL